MQIVENLIFGSLAHTTSVVEIRYDAITEKKRIPGVISKNFKQLVRGLNPRIQLKRKL